MHSVMKKLIKGYIHVYTGNGKGKTTAALGLAFRAMGKGLKTYIGQFIKGQQYGEIKSAELTSGMITIERYGRDSFLHIQSKPNVDDFRMAQEGLSRASAAMLSGKYDIIILDEIITAHYFQVLSLDDILNVIAKKPAHIELIMTGRHAPRKLIEAADLVTSMNEVKHYYKKGIKARDGIER